MVRNGHTGRKDHDGPWEAERNSRLASTHYSNKYEGSLGLGGFSEITQPLNELLKKDRKFEWTTKCQQAFDDLKINLLANPYS